MCKKKIKTCVSEGEKYELTSRLVHEKQDLCSTWTYHLKKKEPIESMFKVQHIKSKAIFKENYQFSLSLPLPSYRFWQTFVWTLIICQNIMGP